jgi:hypothetical protein
MANLVPAHSGSRWEPFPRDAVGGHQLGDYLVSDVSPHPDVTQLVSNVSPHPDVTHRSSRTPRVIAAAIVSVLSLGGTGATVALARSAAPSPTVSTAVAGARAATGHDRGRTLDRGRPGDDRQGGGPQGEDRQGR